MPGRACARPLNVLYIHACAARPHCPGLLSCPCDVAGPISRAFLAWVRPERSCGVEWLNRRLPGLHQPRSDREPGARPRERTARDGESSAGGQGPGSAACPS